MKAHNPKLGVDVDTQLSLLKLVHGAEFLFNWMYEERSCIAKGAEAKIPLLVQKEIELFWISSNKRNECDLLRLQ